MIYSYRQIGGGEDTCFILNCKVIDGLFDIWRLQEEWEEDVRKIRSLDQTGGWEADGIRQKAKWE